MHSSSVTPPPLVLPAPRARWQPLRWTLLFAAAALVLVLLASAIRAGAVVWPECGLKRVTGLPCPGCGGTRSLAALGHGDFAAGLAFNPLAVMAVAAVLASVPVALIDRTITGGRFARAVGAWFRTRAWRWTIVGALAANWVYLIVEGR